jgi:hypothetical protein
VSSPSTGTISRQVSRSVSMPGTKTVARPTTFK